MPTDAFIDKIGIIKQHPNADRLQICFVRNSQCVIGAGEFERFENVLKIEEDAQLDVTRDWTEPFRKYLGSNGRVKSVRLRGEMSRGLVISLKNPLISEALTNIDLTDSTAICNALGITHYEQPCTMLGAKGNLPSGIEKSDEENWQTMDEADLHLGEKALLTHKVDGSSAVLYYNPHTDQLEFCSRTLTLQTETTDGQQIQNNYIQALTPYIPQITALAKSLNEIVAIRGEVYGNGINKNKANKEANLPLSFAMYGVRFPESNDMRKYFGRWNSGWHFTDVNKMIEKLGFKPIPTVTLLGVETVTKELLFKLSAQPANMGEGTVLNGETWSYKAKSDDYCSKLK